MKSTLKAALFLGLSIASMMPAFAAEPSESQDLQKRQLILQLLETTGSMNLGNQMLTKMAEIQKSGETPEVQARIDKLAARMDVTELTNEVVDIYARHFTLDEIQAVVDFYKSPVGRKYIAELPSLMQEGMDAGQKWGARKQEEFIKEIQAGE